MFMDILHFCHQELGARILVPQRDYPTIPTVCLHQSVTNSPIASEHADRENIMNIVVGVSGHQGLEYRPVNI